MGYVTLTTTDKARKGKSTKERTISSIEVAQMMEVEHKEILRKLEGTKRADGTVKQVGIIPTLTKGEIPLSDYFILSSYKDASGKENKCYEITKIGCDFLANKFTGEKGILFTARYVKRFSEMEQVIAQSTINTGIPFKEQVESLEAVSHMLRMNEASKLLMLENFYKGYNIPTGFLPKYENNGSREMKSLTALLKENNCGISAPKFNLLLIEQGYIEEKERVSTKGNGVKKFKSLTDKGLKYGENVVSPHNQRETQPLYYYDTFMELFREVVSSNERVRA